MKSIKSISMAAIAAAVVMSTVSCSVEESISDGSGGGDKRVAVKFAAADIAAVQTRVNGENWEGSEKIGIFMVDHGLTTISESANNIRYETTSTGTDATFTPAGSTIFYPATGSVDFIAYHPHATLTGTWTYAVDVSDQSDQSAIDLLWSGVANGSGSGYNKSSGAVALNFTHKLVKLRMTLTAGDNLSDLTGLSATDITGMNNTASFNVSTGALSSPGTVADIAPKDMGSDVYEAILLPAASTAGYTVVFTVGPDTYTWTLNSGSDAISALVAGKIYDYAITVGKHELTVTGTITDWSSDTGSGDAE
jgi:hypothetical protein